MNPTFTLLEAIAATTVLFFVFAIYRRLTRSPTPPDLLDNNVVVFASAILLTVGVMASLVFEAISLVPFVHSVFWSAVVAVGLHVAIWAVARSIIPLSPETMAKESASG